MFNPLMSGTLEMISSIHGLEENTRLRMDGHIKIRLNSDSGWGASKDPDLRKLFSTLNMVFYEAGTSWFSSFVRSD